MNPDVILGIAVIGGAIALALIGLALRMMRTEREAQAKKTAESRIKPRLAAPPTPEVPSSLPSPTSNRASPASDGATEVLRVLHDPRAGLVVEIGMTRYTHVGQITEDRHRRILSDVANALQQFAQGELGQTPTPIGATAAQPAPQPVSAASPAAPPRQAEEEPLQLPSMNPIKQMQILRERRTRKLREQAEAPPSIVEQIEALLVKRLVGSPFDGRSIHMRPGLYGGAHIDVDGKAYQSVEEVPDPALRDFIKEVVAEWERENDPAARRGRV